MEIVFPIFTSLAIALVLFYLWKGPQFLQEALGGALIAMLFGSVGAYLGTLIFAGQYATPEVLTASVIAASITAIWTYLFAYAHK
ncbi:hypothetical protein EYM_01710 [Ignicoccus islandicus DSM 13165]|uniref:Uncharacterized protein n=1 Tax=Ignicoccus islandicus DSM 13165 TaxID=940295 RepID=A0A0U3G1N5_9CREN|nr:hypothetical protein [Ignicoccus islandicus]ALU12236.1 hypothetical protein EYM_01710 [Ignicoccus islandicus DSM 13165]